MLTLEQFFHLGRWRAVDARGARVSLYRPSSDMGRAGASRAIGKTELDLILQASGVRVPRRRDVITFRVFILVWLLGIIRWLVVRIVNPAEFSGGSLAFCVLVFVLMLIFRPMYVFGARPERFVQSLLLYRRCAQCAYDLSNVRTIEPDGCAVCPECGAAWRIAPLDGTVST